jgi:hypothetical protein
VRAARPELIAVVPVLQREVVHEHLLPDDVYRGLLDGSLGYRVVVAARTRPLLAYAPVPAVNPPVLLFARDDVAAREGRAAGPGRVRLPDGWPRPR